MDDFLWFDPDPSNRITSHSVKSTETGLYDNPTSAEGSEYDKSLLALPCNKTPMPDKDRETGRQYIAVGEAYNAGESIEVFMALYCVGTDMILNHLARFIMADNPLRTAEDLISLSKLLPDQQQNIFHVSDELGSDVLKPVHEKLNAFINYDGVKVMCLCYWCKKM